jgi:beta-aspartyl-dipeptidase (metallo-type)
VATSNPADILQLKGKGYIREGSDVDILILDASFNIIHLMANGVMVK